MTRNLLFALCLSVTPLLLSPDAAKAEPRLLVCPISDAIFLTNVSLVSEQEYVLSEGNWRISVSTVDGTPLTGELFRKYETNQDWVHVGPLDRNNGFFQTPVFGLAASSFFLVQASCGCEAVEVRLDCAAP